MYLLSNGIVISVNYSIHKVEFKTLKLNPKGNSTQRRIHFGKDALNRIQDEMSLDFWQRNSYVSYMDPLFAYIKACGLESNPIVASV